ncbi:MAG: SDR family NAD(P)-dependent oxidoreductase [Alphaproteobacteria bacterium]|nr:SDR family NAD(P)-dependent oxidoreductase [Alphaproteobacteria bacterium]
MRTLQGRVAVVTGAGGGIGRATCAALSAAGCTVVAAELDEAALAGTVAAVPGVDPRVLDVSDVDAIEALADDVLAAHGAVHVLVNNAGLTVVKPFLEHDRADWDRVLGVNLHGVVHGCRVFLPHILAQDEGHVVNISSLFGLVGVPGQSAYCTTKFGVRGLSETLRAELEGSHVGVSVLHPGGIRTGILANATGNDEKQLARLRRAFSKGMLPPEAVADRIVAAIRANRFRIRITKEAFVADWLVRAMPVAGSRLAVSAMSRGLGLGRAKKALPGSEGGR